MASVTDPTGRVPNEYAFQVTRSMTSNAPVGITFPAGFVTTGVRVSGNVASNAGGTATIAVGSTGGASNATKSSAGEWLSAYNVKTNGDILAIPSTVKALGTTLTVPAQVTAFYDETGSASTSGGPWTVVISGFNS